MEHRAHATHTTRSSPATLHIPLPFQPTDADPANAPIEGLQDVSASHPLSASPPAQSEGGDRPLHFHNAVGYHDALGYHDAVGYHDALGYLDAIKAQFLEQPEVWKKFLGILKDFEAQL